MTKPALAERPLDRGCSTPLWEQAADRLEELASSLGPGARLPSERSLCKALGVQRVTMQKAVDRLTSQGIIRSKRGQGRFVARRTACEPIALLQFHIPSAEDVVYTTHMRGVCRALAGTEHRLMPSLVTPDGPPPETIIASLRAARVAGVIVDRFSVPEDVDFVLRLHEAFPLVTMSKEFLQAPTPCAQADPYRSTARMVAHFRSRGCRSAMAFARGREHTITVRRCEAFVSAAEAVGYADVEVVWEDTDRLGRLLDELPRPVSVLGSRGKEALDVRRLSEERGMVLGRDVLIGTNVPEGGKAEYQGMALVVRNEDRLGYEAAMLLLRHMDGKTAPREVVNVPCRLVFPEPEA